MIGNRSLALIGGFVVFPDMPPRRLYRRLKYRKCSFASSNIKENKIKIKKIYYWGDSIYCHDIVVRSVGFTVVGPTKTLEVKVPLTNRAPVYLHGSRSHPCVGEDVV